MSQQINLFNPVFLVQEKYFSALTMLQGLAIVLAGSLAIYGFEVHQNSSLEQALTDTDKQLTARRDQALKFTKEFSAQGRSRALADDLARTEERLRLRRDLLKELQTGVGGNADGFAPVLTALARQRLEGVWLTGVDIGGAANEVVIRGRVLDSELVPAYIRLLNRESPFAGRSVGELRVAAKGATGAPAGPTVAGEPARYVEFLLTIPLGQGTPSPRAGAAKGAS